MRIPCTIANVVRLDGVVRDIVGGRPMILTPCPYDPIIVGGRCTVHRRYSMFSRLREMLEEVCRGMSSPAWAIPALPSKKYLGRSHVRKVAEERIPGVHILSVYEYDLLFLFLV